MSAIGTREEICHQLRQVYEDCLAAQTQLKSQYRALQKENQTLCGIRASHRSQLFIQSVEYEEGAAQSHLQRYEELSQFGSLAKRWNDQSVQLQTALNMMRFRTAELLIDFKCLEKASQILPQRDISVHCEYEELHEACRKIHQTAWIVQGFANDFLLELSKRRSLVEEICNHEGVSFRKPQQEVAPEGRSLTSLPIPEIGKRVDEALQKTLEKLSALIAQVILQTSSRMRDLFFPL